MRKYTKRNINKFNFPRLSVTAWLIIVNVLFFAIAFPLMLINQDYSKYISLQPSYILQGKYLWTFVTSMFMHGGIAHLLVNMFVLFSLGSFCEKVIGRKRFFWFYIVSGLIAGVAFVLLSGFFGNTDLGAKIFGSPLIAGVGASGAIFAIAGLFVVLTPKLKFSIIFFPFFSLPAYIMIPLVLFATWLVSAGTGLPIGNTAHFGGFLVGIIYGFYLKKRYSRKIEMLNKYIK
ncbi:MAG: rhomboid family intramembrane serine protease [Nanoarchaeota archaeon]